MFGFPCYCEFLLQAALVLPLARAGCFAFITTE
jgi:hypothetical protein